MENKKESMFEAVLEWRGIKKRARKEARHEINLGFECTNVVHRDLIEKAAKLFKAECRQNNGRLFIRFLPVEFETIDGVEFKTVKVSFYNKPTDVTDLIDLK